MVVTSQLKLVLQITLLLLSLYLGLTVHTVLKASPEITKFLYSETSVYEVFSHWLWGVLALLSLISSMSLRLRISVAVAALLMGARELDMHKSLFSMSFIKTKFYTSADISFNEKLIGATILILILLLAGYLLAQLLQRMKQRRLDAPMALMLMGFGMGLVSKVLDRFSSQMRELFNIFVTNETRLMIMALEESLEMIIPVFLIVALLIYNATQKQRSA